MSGIEKITERILSDARADAEKLSEQGRDEAEKIYGGYKERSESIIENRRRTSSEEAETLIGRARASEANIRRNLLLEAKNEMLDLAFTSAIDVFLKMDAEEYLYFVKKLLGAALERAVARERESIETYGDEFSSAASYVVRLNARDLERIGGPLAEYGREIASGLGKDFELDKTAAAIDGGFILRTGDVDTNCSLSIMAQELRPALEGEVYATLFGKSGDSNG